MIAKSFYFVLVALVGTLAQLSIAATPIEPDKSFGSNGIASFSLPYVDQLYANRLHDGGDGTLYVDTQEGSVSETRLMRIDSLGRTQSLAPVPYIFYIIAQKKMLGEHLFVFGRAFDRKSLENTYVCYEFGAQGEIVESNKLIGRPSSERVVMTDDGSFITVVYDTLGQSPGWQRFDKRCKVDVTFGVNGTLEFPPPPFAKQPGDGSFNSVHVYPSGRIAYLERSAQGTIWWREFNRDGSLDTLTMPISLAQELNLSPSIFDWRVIDERKFLVETIEQVNGVACARWVVVERNSDVFLPVQRLPQLGLNCSESIPTIQPETSGQPAKLHLVVPTRRDASDAQYSVLKTLDIGEISWVTSEEFMSERILPGLGYAYDSVVDIRGLSDGSTAVLTRVNNFVDPSFVRIRKFQRGGTLDVNFGLNGALDIRAPSRLRPVRISDFFDKSNGQIIVAGGHIPGGNSNLFAINSIGTLDASFGTDLGYSTLIKSGQGSLGRAIRLVPTADDGILAASTWLRFTAGLEIGNYPAVTLAKLSSSGIQSTPFSTQPGIGVAGECCWLSRLFDVETAIDGRALAFGVAENVMNIAQYDALSQLSGGYSWTRLPIKTHNVSAFALPDGGWVVVALGEGGTKALKLDKNLRPDLGFGQNGELLLSSDRVFLHTSSKLLTGRAIGNALVLSQVGDYALTMYRVAADTGVFTSGKLVDRDIFHMTSQVMASGQILSLSSRRTGGFPLIELQQIDFTNISSPEIRSTRKLSTVAGLLIGEAPYVDYLVIDKMVVDEVGQKLYLSMSNTDYVSTYYSSSGFTAPVERSILLRFNLADVDQAIQAIPVMSGRSLIWCSLVLLLLGFRRIRMGAGE
jgi:hypothetical protein